MGALFAHWSRSRSSSRLFVAAAVRHRNYRRLLRVFGAAFKLHAGEGDYNLGRRWHMPLFMDVHNGMTGITAETLRLEHEKDLKAQSSEKGVHFMKAWADPKAGKVFCLCEGPNRAAVERVHKKAGHPADEVFEVSVQVE